MPPNRLPGATQAALDRLPRELRLRTLAVIVLALLVLALVFDLPGLEDQADPYLDELQEQLEAPAPSAEDGPDQPTASP